MLEKLKLIIEDLNDLFRRINNRIVTIALCSISFISVCVSAMISRYPVSELSDYYGLFCSDLELKCSNLLLKLFLVLGFSPNKGFPLERVTREYNNILGWELWGKEDERYHSLRNAYLERVKLLIEYGADINYQNQTIRDTPLTLFIRKGWLKELDFLIEKGADVNNDIWFDHYNDGNIEIEYVSPLQYAADCSRLDTALLLIDRGANFEYSDIPRIFSEHSYYGVSSGGYAEAKILREIYTEELLSGTFPRTYNADSSTLGELLKRYKNEHNDEINHDKIEPIFRNVLSKHILPKVQDEQIKRQLNDFLSGTGNSVEDISAQASTSNDLQNLHERQAEVVTIENISKAQKEREGLSISSN